MDDRTEAGCCRLAGQAAQVKTNPRRSQAHSRELGRVLRAGRRAGTQAPRKTHLVAFRDRKEAGCLQHSGGWGGRLQVGVLGEFSDIRKPSRPEHKDFILCACDAESLKGLT